MTKVMGSGRACVEWLKLVALGVVLALSGCATSYVDGNLPETPKAEFKQPARPPAIQLVFEFQTKGTPNPRATDLLKAQVKAQVTDSGLFSSVSDAPVPGAALLTFTLNNIPLTDNPAAKGFVTGLTFGLAGTTVADGYDAKLSFASPEVGTLPVVEEAKHVIHTSIGTGSPPAGAIKTGGMEEAARLMLKQVLGRLLANLSNDSAFPSGKAAGTPADVAKQM